ncbi:hypothetical protein BDV32DRAFT_103764 [Aspergillus pseudonomiae]|uniref:Uncharacterized protein n=1 Tax=Aspergillus pseudonomiae TaxID=1506151 RepID=A0A5N7D2C7_9EURO|nr:uncharacterized protein BDV37DRAFT_203619 [Aspergillus pseudonomiae]KAB8263764.1 hypothetical protein BDV32DRAFT_103764 [Aspergillus pseudonomiae]KAE8400399.1 hypothetical protein BDV37DRAFT_203619 [Aspergillus pseudonomiae]
MIIQITMTIITIKEPDSHRSMDLSLFLSLFFPFFFFFFLLFPGKGKNDKIKSNKTDPSESLNHQATK